MIKSGLLMITGFGSAPLVACCGDDSPYNSNSSIMRGTETTRVCSDPSRYIGWDGIHLTIVAYKIVVAGLMDGSFTVSPTNHICPYLESEMNQAHHIL